MAKVRVPKEMRPPSRFEPFKDTGMNGITVSGLYRCTGAYRVPRAEKSGRPAEWFWDPEQGVLWSGCHRTTPHVILEQVPK